MDAPSGRRDATRVRRRGVDERVSFIDDRHRHANPDLRRSMRLTSANSVNIGRLLPQSVYYFHAMGQVGQVGQVGQLGRVGDVVFCTPSGNFGNLTAGLMAKRAGLPIARFDAIDRQLRSSRKKQSCPVAAISR